MPPRRNQACYVAATALVLTAIGCSTMDTIDRKTQELLFERSASIGGEALAPDRTYPDAASLSTGTQADTSIPTENPDASDLQYKIAPADRDVAERLDEYAVIPSEGLQLDLRTAFEIAQRSGREFQTQEEDYILAAIRLLIERHRWGPRFFNDTTASVNGSFDGDVDTPLRVINELRVTQQLPYGGAVEARALYDATEQLRQSVTDDYTQAATFALSADIPLLRGAGLVAREDLIQRERDLIYAARTFERFRRSYLVDIATDFFDLMTQRDRIRNQERSIASNVESAEREAARVEAGRRPPFAARQFEQSVLQLRSELISLREVYLSSLDRFKIRLGIPVDTSVVILPATLELPEPAASPSDAALLALQYRLDLQNDRDRLDDARRSVSNARNDLLPDLDIGLDLAVNTGDERVGGLGLEFGETDYAASVTFGLPLDREIEQLNLRSAVIGLQRNVRDYQQSRDQIILDARRARRAIDEQRFRLVLAQERVEVNRLSVEEQKIRDADPFDLTQAEDSLLQSENDRDRALQQLRIAVLDYLLTTGQLRVTKAGEFDPIGEMGAAIEAQRQGAAAPPPAP